MWLTVSLNRFIRCFLFYNSCDVAISNGRRIAPAYDDLARKYRDVLFLKVLETECQELMVRGCDVYNV